MRIPPMKTLALLALAAVSSLALAQEPPARVGRVAVAQGQVSISADVGEEATPALVNWPVTSRNQITTGAGARTELRVGSSVVRLDGDSSLDIVQLDDDNLRLHLHYGSVTVRLRNADVLPGFELSTPQGRITLQQLGRLRVDAERVQGTTAVTSFDGALARVDGGGGSVLIVRSGKRLDLRADDIRTGLAGADSFDDWGMLRDARDARVTSDRYVTNEMTGYEDLDQHGAWRDDAEYGPIWYPSNVGADWAPYRDGRWTWVAPWGWTWVDNAPWGYAPFHYGRWVMVDRRWCWAPGRNVGRPVWSPALVGWVGGSNWNVTFGSGGAHRQAPAQGWYPLAPREVFAPSYHVSAERLHYINRFARPDVRPDPAHHAGLTVVPQEQFGHRGPVLVNTAPRATTLPQVVQNLPVGAPPAPLGAHRQGEVRDLRSVGDGRDGRGRDGRDGRPEQRPAPVVLTAPAVAAPARPAGVVAVQPGAPVNLRDEQRNGRNENGRNGEEGRRDGRNDDGRRPPVQAGAGDARVPGRRCGPND